MSSAAPARAAPPLERRLEALLGSAGVSALRAGSAEIPLALPASESAALELVKLALAERLALLPLGFGSKLGWAAPPGRADFAVSTRRLRGILAHEPGDGTLTARAGTSMAELAAAVAAHGQCASPDVPAPGAATLGGVLAAGQSGFDRLRRGPARAQVLGMRVITGFGTLARSGGQLVKNVTGYDLQRLYSGSHGSLCLIVEASIRLHPAPEWTVLRELEGDRAAPLLETARELAAAPVRWLALRVAGAGDTWTLAAVFAGRREVVEAEETGVAARLSGAARWCGAEARARAEALRDRAVADGAWPDIEVACMPSRAASAVAAIERLARDAGCQPCFDVDPALAWIAVRLTPPEPLPERALAALHAAVAALPGQAHWRRLAPEAARDLAPLPVAPAARDLMARVKRALDPHGVFASGRFGRSTPSVRATEEP